MIPRPNTVPLDAEHLDIMPCLTQCRVPSVLAPGAMQLKFTFRCPACSTEMAEPPYTEPARCECGLVMQQSFAMGVWAWRTKAPLSRAEVHAEISHRFGDDLGPREEPTLAHEFQD
jgi:hypothetical protein